MGALTLLKSGTGLGLGITLIGCLFDAYGIYLLDKEGADWTTLASQASMNFIFNFDRGARATFAHHFRGTEVPKMKNVFSVHEWGENKALVAKATVGVAALAMGEPTVGLLSHHADFVGNVAVASAMLKWVGEPVKELSKLSAPTEIRKFQYNSDEVKGKISNILSSAGDNEDQILERFFTELIFPEMKTVMAKKKGAGAIYGEVGALSVVEKFIRLKKDYYATRESEFEGRARTIDVSQTVLGGLAPLLSFTQSIFPHATHLVEAVNALTGNQANMLGANKVDPPHTLQAHFDSAKKELAPCVAKFDDHR